MPTVYHNTTEAEYTKVLKGAEYLHDNFDQIIYVEKANGNFYITGVDNTGKAEFGVAKLSFVLNGYDIFFWETFDIHDQAFQHIQKQIRNDIPTEPTKSIQLTQSQINLLNDLLQGENDANIDDPEHQAKLESIQNALS